MIQTSDAMIQPEMMALQNISPEVLVITSSERVTKAAARGDVEDRQMNEGESH
ncbi:hypothetical protein SGGMMB4_03799 [Sodalis glossinidius str. 'morsitans']|uniref:Uncharacterized protein n=1 Tax=Sodalis glossinidius (strain morsitans) TaxID=343509 RepID=A0A193QKR3_SODGM|nr:hypothetical protein SGGMMB4_03799 [Sodalis glossinidius str. 'morsitans']